MKKVPVVICAFALIFALLAGYISSYEARCGHKQPIFSSSYSPKTLAEEKKNYNFNTVKEDYFDDALFIGDSRTVGLQKYAGLYNADYFAQVGLTVYRAFNVVVEGRTLLDTLKGGSYGKVYIMFGVNELTADLEASASEFCKLLKTVREYQPDALIFIQANLHVGKNRSESWELYSNERLDEYNNLLSVNADNKRIFYIDPNEVYDDEEGNLSYKYTSDELHLNADCHRPWVEYLLTHAVKK